MPQGFQPTAPVQVLERGPGGQTLLPLCYLLCFLVEGCTFTSWWWVLENIQDAP